MDQNTKPIIFRSRAYPEVTVTLNQATYRTRRIVDELTAQNGHGGPVELAWKAYVRDFDGITLDGEKPSVEALLLDGPGDLVAEVIEEIGRISTSTAASSDRSDEETIASCLDCKAARERMEARKNSEPATSPATTAAGIQTAGDASGTAPMPSGSGASETAMASPA